MVQKRKPPPLPRKARSRKARPPKATQEIQPTQIVGEEPSVDQLAGRYLDPSGRRRPPPPPARKRAPASGTTQEVASVQVISERPTTTAQQAAVRPLSAVYERVARAAPPSALSHDEGVLLSVIDGRRDLQVLSSVSGIDVVEVQRLLQGLEQRRLVALRS